MQAGALAAKKSDGKRATAAASKKQTKTTKRVARGAAAQRVKVRLSAAKATRAAAHLNAIPRRTAAVLSPSRLSYGQAYGLHETLDPLALKSSVALVLDQDTDEVLLSKNSQAVLPIASITKLMTALVVVEAKQPLDEVLTITEADIDTEKGSHSRLSPGTALTRGEMLHLALMSSENRAANALGRHYPGGLATFVTAMNRKAAELGMHDTRYVEPTGLSSRNQSSARDLATLVKFAYRYDLIRELSTSPEYQVAVGSRQLQFRNTNGLVFNPSWQIGLQKTGYIAEAGRCLVMQAYMGGRQLIMVFLDSTGRYSRIGDAERVRKWVLEEMAPVAEPTRPTVPVNTPSQHTPRVTS
ncbi:peptidase S11 [Caldimonas brevitalea]|uniref:Peptidase S11 n=2 Tax=Caldimonas brevitalea TaxID=413882 RepID=A0A0G3BGE2_9BURK|nr:peptidase S11 [Caldimonas brevitalea]